MCNILDIRSEQISPTFAKLGDAKPPIHLSSDMTWRHACGSGKSPSTRIMYSTVSRPPVSISRSCSHFAQTKGAFSDFRLAHPRHGRWSRSRKRDLQEILQSKRTAQIAEIYNVTEAAVIGRCKRFHVELASAESRRVEAI